MSGHQYLSVLIILNEKSYAVGKCHHATNIYITVETSGIN